MSSPEFPFVVSHSHVTWFLEDNTPSTTTTNLSTQVPLESNKKREKRKHLFIFYSVSSFIQRLSWMLTTVKMIQSLLIAGGLLVSSAAAIVPEFQSILQNTHRSNEYGYPTDLTRGIMPVSAANRFLLNLRGCHLHWARFYYEGVVES